MLREEEMKELKVTSKYMRHFYKNYGVIIEYLNYLSKKYENIGQFFIQYMKSNVDRIFFETKTDLENQTERQSCYNRLCAVLEDKIVIDEFDRRMEALECYKDSDVFKAAQSIADDMFSPISDTDEWRSYWKNEAEKIDKALELAAQTNSQAKTKDGSDYSSSVVLRMIVNGFSFKILGLWSENRELAREFVDKKKIFTKIMTCASVNEFILFCRDSIVSDVRACYDTRARIRRGNLKESDIKHDIIDPRKNIYYGALENGEEIIRQCLMDISKEEHENLRKKQESRLKEAHDQLDEEYREILKKEHEKLDEKYKNLFEKGREGQDEVHADVCKKVNNRHQVLTGSRESFFQSTPQIETPRTKSGGLKKEKKEDKSPRKPFMDRLSLPLPPVNDHTSSDSSGSSRSNTPKTLSSSRRQSRDHAEGSSLRQKS